MIKYIIEDLKRAMFSVKQLLSNLDMAKASDRVCIFRGMLTILMLDRFYSLTLYIGCIYISNIG